MFLKDPLNLMLECAGSDLDYSTDMIIKESNITSVYNSIQEASEDMVYAAEAIPVIKMDGVFVTEMNFLAPFIKTNNIKSISEALDHLARVNNINDKVGLLIENNTDELEEAFKLKKSKLVDKFMKGGDLANKLKTKGHPILKKKYKKNK